MVPCARKRDASRFDGVMRAREHVPRFLWIAGAFACLLVLSCEHETLERPIQSSRGDVGGPPSVPSLSPLPLPSTAFTGPAEPAPRFETRRIGAEPEPRARAHRGAPVDLDLKNADLPNVFRLLAEVGHVNIVVAGEITGTVTLRLRHVPWDEALEVIVRAKDLEMERDGNVIVVRPRGPHSALSSPVRWPTARSEICRRGMRRAAPSSMRSSPM